MSRAPLIVIEGIDYSGKTTQAARLVRALNERGVRTTSWHYPIGTSELGKLILRVLSGEIVVPDDSLLTLFTANRLESRPQIERAIVDGVAVICDRYSPSEYAYGCAKGLPLEWLVALESRMPPADLIFLLNISAAEAATRKRSKQGRDVFESNLPFLERVREMYLQFASRSPSCVVIDAEEHPDAIAELILREVLRLCPH